MTERGGPTTQSGVFYQNSIAAVFLGRLCDRRKQDRSVQVVEVRSEVPSTSVDDIVVTFRDGHRMWIQAKENLATSGKVWEELWANFATQRRAVAFGLQDELILYVGTYAGVYDELQEAANRARGSSNPAEWINRLTRDQSDAITKVKNCLTPDGADLDSLIWHLMGKVHVEVLPLTLIVRAWTPNFCPPSNHSFSKLLSLLRDKVAERSRNRRTFHPDELLAELELDGVIFDDGVRADEHTLVMLGPGITIVAPESTITTTSSQWTFEIEKFLTGDKSELFSYVDNFHSLHEAFHTITCNTRGCGREVISPPRITGKRVGVDVELSRRRTSTQPAFTADMDIAISDDGEVVEVSGKVATEQQIVLSLAQNFGTYRPAPHVGSIVATLCNECPPSALSERLKAEILRLSVFEVQSIVQIKTVKAKYHAETSTLDLEVWFDDVQDGLHTFSRSVHLDHAKPLGTEVTVLRAMPGARVERTLRALAGFAIGADVQVSLDELRAALLELDVEERDLQRRLESLRERGDITTWSLDNERIRATLSGVVRDQMILSTFTP